MESQLQRPSGHAYDDPHDAPAIHSVAEDEGEYHEKKSVLKKVKAKAKKIKDTLTKHGHGHEHEYHREDPQEDEEDEDEEIVEDPEVHGAPMYESSAVRSDVPSQGMNLEKPTAAGDDRYGTWSSDQVVERPGVQGQQHDFGESGTHLGRPTAREGAHVPEDKNVSFPPEIHGTRDLHPSDTDKNVETMQKQGGRIGVLEALDEDPNYALSGTKLLSNYESKVTGPTRRGEKAEISPLIQSLDKMNVSGESIPKPEVASEHRGHAGSRDQFAPQTTPTTDEFAFKPSTTSSDQASLEATPKIYDPSKPEEQEMPRDTLTGKASNQSGYIEKISTATSALAGKAVSAKNVVASKLGYGGTEGDKIQETGEGKEATTSAAPTEYAHKVAATVAERLAPVYEKVAGAGSSVISKVKGSTTSAGKDEPPQINTEGVGSQETIEGKEPGKSASPTQYAHKVASTVTGKFAPVYEKVADAGNAVISKVKPSPNAGKEESPGVRNEGESKSADKGVSVKEYLAEKFKPGDEDKALSEVITETLQKKKEESGKKEESKPMGKVKESEEVVRHLGSGTENKREGNDAVAAGTESSGKGVVNRIRDAVTLWVGKGNQEQQHSEGSVGPLGSTESLATEERRPQESVS